jgi:4-amino-4-deoxy-L-arabinose transferase-like glycosyltransferase
MDLSRKKTNKVISKIFTFFKKEKNTLFLIFILGLALRLSGVLNITLSGDNLTHWKIAGDIATKGIFPLLGPRASLTGDFNLGPFYYYLLAIPYWLGRGDFRAAIVFFALLNSLSIPLLYFVAKRWFSKYQSMLISLLFACSAYFIQIQSFPWNPYVLPLFIILSLYFINKVSEKKYINFFFFAISYAICLQLHATAIFLLPVFIYLLPIRKIPLKYYLFGIGTLVVVNLPWVFVNLTSNFSQIKAGLLIFSPIKSEQCSITSWLVNHGKGERCFWYFRNTLFAFRLFSVSIFSINSIPLSLLTMTIVALYFIKTRLKENKYLFVWLLTPILLFLFYSNNVYLHYFLILTPVPFFLLMVYLEKLKTRKGRWILSGNLLYSIIILINLYQYVWSLQFIRG